MARKVQIATLGSLAVAGLLAAGFGGAYHAARQVRPFYTQALELKPEVLEQGSRELESRATALYSNARKQGQWQALFTAEQINGWLATQLAKANEEGPPTNFRDPRVAIARDLLTLGFRTTHGGIDTVISVDASVFLTAEGAVGIRLMSVRAGALPLPVMQLADDIATACQELALPVRWTRQDNQPVAVVDIHSDPAAEKRQFHIDSIELGEGELYVAGHTELKTAANSASFQSAEGGRPETGEIELTEYELRLTPNDEHGAIEIARRPAAERDESEKSSDR